MSMNLSNKFNNLIIELELICISPKYFIICSQIVYGYSAISLKWCLFELI